MSGRERLAPTHTAGRKARDGLNLIRTRFPHRSEILPVLSVAIFVCFSWSILGFFNKFSSFILYFTTAEIAEIFAYMMAFALLESLIATGLLLLLSAILPSNWLKDGFAVKGFVILAVATAASIVFQKSLKDDFPSTIMLLASVVLPIVVTVLLILFIHSRPRLQDFLLSIEDRVLIMLFVYVPIGLLSLLVVMYKTIL